MAKMEPSREQVTSKKAQAWLKLGPADFTESGDVDLDGVVRNRRLNENDIIKYAAYMEQGEFIETNDAICFTDDGRLINGQHRLTAIILSGKAQWMLVLRNLDPAAIHVMDRGRKRSLADEIYMRGEPYAQEIASAIKKLAAFDRNGTFRALLPHETPSDAVLLEYWRDHLDIKESVQPVQGKRASIGLGIRGSTLAVLHYRMKAVDASDADTFLALLLSGEALPKGNPILLLRHRLIENRATVRKMTDNETAAITIKAWVNWRSGETMKVLAWRGGGKSPEAMPVIA